VLTALLILSAPFIVYYVINRFIPILDDPAHQVEAEDRPAAE